MTDAWPSPSQGNTPEIPLNIQVGIAHGISPTDAQLLLTGTDEETLTRQAEALAAKQEARPPRAAVVPSEGRNPKPPMPNPMMLYARELFGRHPYNG